MMEPETEKRGSDLKAYKVNPATDAQAQLERASTPCLRRIAPADVKSRQDSGKVARRLLLLSLLVCLNQVGQDLLPAFHDQEVASVGDEMSLATGQGSRERMSDR
jgi:hypothetical protein